MDKTGNQGQAQILISRCFTELLAYTVLLRKTAAQKQPGFGEVQGKIKQLLADSTRTSTEMGIDPRDYDEARFAVCAWMDETIMNMPWVHRGEWQRTLLQSELYGTNNAGDEFFEHLNRLGPNQNRIREVYYICLCLGFMGRYCHPGDEILLQQLRMSNASSLLGSRSSVDVYGQDPLFDFAYEQLDEGRAGFMPMRSLSNLFAKSSILMLVVVPSLIVIALYIIYNFTLNENMTTLLNRLIG